MDIYLILIIMLILIIVFGYFVFQYPQDKYHKSINKQK